jgi:hypothetical protein
MKKLLIVPVMFLASCSSLEVIDGAVDKYCELSPTQRLANREAIAEVVAPNTIQIECVDNAEDSI